MAASVSLRLQAMSTPSLRESREHFEDALMLLPAERHPRSSTLGHGSAMPSGRRGESNVDVSREQCRRVSGSIAVYDLVGATAWHDCCAMSVRPGGARPLDRRSVKRLTPQQKRVCGLIARGATNREAAELLFLSTKAIGSPRQRGHESSGGSQPNRFDPPIPRVAGVGRVTGSVAPAVSFRVKS